ncbi:hypothetical protein LSH36_423g00004 [Paralvinella palmiformis]|uniref:Uncharacterized protein n=1 Tax=Paralvinella palmiformis TaxID=53620 RepID=A0AAD9N044_9ANNE|nr:hypothetical protein LSH36_423g00004 [Paralvinella palmiformis]
MLHSSEWMTPLQMTTWWSAYAWNVVPVVTASVSVIMWVLE